MLHTGTCITQVWIFLSGFFSIILSLLPSSYLHLFISLMARSGACIGKVPNPIKRVGWAFTVWAKSSLTIWQRSNVSSGLAYRKMERYSMINCAKCHNKHGTRNLTFITLKKLLNLVSIP